MMKPAEQVKAAKEFVKRWSGRGYEKGESQSFWSDLLMNVFGIEQPTQYMVCEKQIMLEHTSFIDIYIPDTKVIIEQKSIGKELTKAIKQSDGTFLSPMQQMLRYANAMDYDEMPRWGISCNFQEFMIFDFNNKHSEPELIKLEDLPKEYHRLSFLVAKDTTHIKKEVEISIEAGKIVSRIYDAVRKGYKEENEEMLKSLNVLCVRLIFCMYAEDAGIFVKDQFYNYMKQFKPQHFRKELTNLFEVLNTPYSERDEYLEDDLAAFPYVNGGLFADKIIIPQFDADTVEFVLEEAAFSFNWKPISPTIFGAVFESTLSTKLRRAGGMHYTSIENIHKVIDPLFLDELYKEFDNIMEIKQSKSRKNLLNQFQSKLAGLTFFDPACGSGNFLTETYICLRRLENRIVMALQGDNIQLDYDESRPIQVSIKQFYGIEINDFAVSVAKTALWIAEYQMMEETRQIVDIVEEFLPLKSYANIVEGNALRMDWNEVVPANELNYIMGNPPFVGIRHSNINHREDLKNVTSVIPKSGCLDYVSAWYVIANNLMRYNHEIKTAFVSTNSIVQGEQANILWKFLYSDETYINFAYKTFRWDSQSTDKAAVHCVIIGYWKKNESSKTIFNGDSVKKCSTITQYLNDGNIVWIDKAKKPLSDVPEMVKGCYPTDNGNYIFDENEMLEFVKKEPLSKKYFRRWIGSEDLINRKKRYILFLKKLVIADLKSMPMVKERIDNVKQFRLKSTKAATRKKAETPHLLDEERIPQNTFLVLPVVSSENRKYIPLDYRNPPDICYASAFFIENVTLYIFGILTSNVHMEWMRTVAGRLKSDYRYSNTIVYNTFPWCSPTDKQKAKIEKTAQAILDARALYPDCSLADMYGDNMYLFPELLKAHQANDKAVMEAYGFIKTVDGKTTWYSPSECVAALMKMYQDLTSK